MAWKNFTRVACRMTGSLLVARGISHMNEEVGFDV
jgi:hypothetical protein